MKLTDADWDGIWSEFDDRVDDMNESYQQKMIAEHGEGHYYLDGNEDWEFQKLAIEALVNEKLKEKNI